MNERNTRWIAAGSAAVAAIVVFSSVTPTAGHPTYNSSPGGGNCVTCHGGFSSNTSPQGTVFPSGGKHVMHRSSSAMNTECTLCHTVVGDNPMLNSSAGTPNTPGLGCIGCHGRDEGGGFGVSGAGLRRHHLMNNVTACLVCHFDDPVPVPESVNPPYYGSFDTNAFDPCNNPPTFGENWSLDPGNTHGLDNDGDNVYDTVDDDCGGCPWDCGGDNDGAIGIVDLLALLSQWGLTAGSCDFGAGSAGVGISELLVMLGRWGPCP
jgi:hypothetical protein